MMKTLKRIITIVVVVVVLGGGFMLWGGYRARQEAAETMANLQTVSIARGPLVSTIGATGTVRANQTAVLAWQTSGSVGELHVKAGDTVQAEQELARLDPASLPQSVILAQTDLVSAQNALEALQEPPTELMLAQAEQAIVNAQQAIDFAERRLNNLVNYTPSQTDIDAAMAQVALAESSLNRAKEAYAPFANKPEDDPTRAALLSRMAQAQAQYDLAVRNYNYLTGTASELDVALAEADLVVAQAQLEAAEQALEDLLAGPDPDDMAAAEARMAAAQATLDTAFIEAPFAGTITEVNLNLGDQVAPGTIAFRLDDLSRLLVDVYISEVDVNQIAEGQAVTLVFDAILDEEYDAEVIEVALVGTAIQGVVNFKVTVELTAPDQKVRPGMTAAVNIVIERYEDVLLVPNRAIRVVDGQRVVYVLREIPAEENAIATQDQGRGGFMDGLRSGMAGGDQLGGGIQMIAITLGASSETYSEVIDGDLQAGDLVILNPPATNGFGGMGGGPFGGGMRP